jgi:hypothetical protein
METQYFHPAANTGRLPASVSALAWSAEQHDYSADPIDAANPSAAESFPGPRWYLRPRLLASSAAGLVAVAAAGLFLTLHSTSPSVAAPAATPSSTAQPPVSVSAPPPTPVNHMASNRHAHTGQTHRHHSMSRPSSPAPPQSNSPVPQSSSPVPQSSSPAPQYVEHQAPYRTTSTTLPDWVYQLPIHLGHRGHRHDDTDGQ